ncbi:hypothetical protein VTH06DRAFT_33 [Thermothelomyces fergusii]
MLKVAAAVSRDETSPSPSSTLVWSEGREHDVQTADIASLQYFPETLWTLVYGKRGRCARSFGCKRVEIWDPQKGQATGERWGAGGRFV